LNVHEAGADTAQMGTGNDTFQWDPGDGSDTADGQSGTDTLAFNGSNIGEDIHVTGHQLTRNVASVTTDYTSVEGVNVRTLGGVDIVRTDDLAGLKSVGVDLGAFDGTPDATPDTVIATGTDKRDVVTVTKTGAQALIKGLPAQIAIAGSDPALDLLRVNTLAGDDNVTVAPDVVDLMATAVDLGADS